MHSDLKASKNPGRAWNAHRTLCSGNSRGNMMACECFRGVHHTEMVMRHPEFRIMVTMLCGGPGLDQLIA